MSERKFWELLSHWNNFTLPVLKEIFEHCVALERLGIAQDDKMMASIERDITLREKKAKRRQQGLESEPTAQRPKEDYLLVPNVLQLEKRSKIEKDGLRRLWSSRQCSHLHFSFLSPFKIQGLSKPSKTKTLWRALAGARS